MVGSVPVEVKGVEAEVVYTPNQNFMVGAVLSYADGKIKNGLLPCLDLNGDGVPDAVTTPPTLAQLQAATGADGLSACPVTQRANISPPFSATVQAEYNQDLSDRLNGYVRGLYAFKGKSQNDPNNPFDQVKAYGILNLYAGVRDPDGAWDLSLYGKNITNTFRVLSRTNGPLTTNTNGALFSYTNYYGIAVTEPREFGVNLRVAFGSR